MNLTAIMFLGVFGGCLSLSVIRHPFFGLLAYLWVFYNPPAQRWWGEALPDLRWSLIAGIVTVLAIHFHSSMKKNYLPWHESWGARFLILWSINLWVQSAWAVDLSTHLEGCILFTKYILLFYIIYRLILTEEDFDNFILANVLGGFVFGWIAYSDAGGGRLEQVGGPGVSDANTLSMHLSVFLALAGFLFMNFRGYRKWVVCGCIPFILNGIVLTGSRSALLGLLCGGIAALVLAPTRGRKALLGIGVLGIILFSSLAHNEFWERMESILPDEEGQLEASAESRIPIFEAGWEIAKDYPMGVGYGGHEFLSSRYISEELLSHGTRAAHNTGMGILVEGGFFGLFLFVFLCIWVGTTMRKIKSLDELGLKPSLGFSRAGLGSGMVVFFISGQFHNFMHAEIAVWMLALLSALFAISQQSISIAPNVLSNIENIPQPVNGQGPLSQRSKEAVPRSLSASKQRHN